MEPTGCLPLRFLHFLVQAEVWLNFPLVLGVGYTGFMGFRDTHDYLCWHCSTTTTIRTVSGDALYVQGFY